MLEWLGDVGGLFDGLRIIGHFFVAPIASYAMRTELLTLIFRLIVIRKSKPERLPGMRESTDSNHVAKKIHRQSMLKNILCPCLKQRLRNKKMLVRADSAMN